MPRLQFGMEATILCTAARIETRSELGDVAFSLDDSGEAALAVEAKVTTKIAPRNKLVGKVLGLENRFSAAKNTVFVNISAHTENGSSARIEIQNPLIAAQVRAATETIFGHLATNCAACPVASICGSQESLGRFARDLQVSLTTPHDEI